MSISEAQARSLANQLIANETGLDRYRNQFDFDAGRVVETPAGWFFYMQYTAQNPRDVLMIGAPAGVWVEKDKPSPRMLAWHEFQELQIEALEAAQYPETEDEQEATRALSRHMQQLANTLQRLHPEIDCETRMEDGFTVLHHNATGLEGAIEGLMLLEDNGTRQIKYVVHGPSGKAQVYYSGEEGEMILHINNMLTSNRYNA